MRRLHKFLCLPLKDKLLLFKATFLVSTFKIILLTFPLKHIQQFTNSINHKPSKFKIIPREKIVWAVKTAGCYLFGPKSCLPLALTVQVLLKQYGYPANISFGVYKGDEIKLEGHAWVESEGRIVVGEETAKYYTQLSTDLQGI